MLTANLASVNNRLTSTDSSQLMVSINLDHHILDHRSDHKTIGKQNLSLLSSIIIIEHDLVDTRYSSH